MLTNEELMYTYKTRAENEEEILEAIFRKNEGLILSIAKEVAGTFHCMQLNNSGSVSVYSKQILNELREEGTVELFRVIRAGEYDETRAKFTTYLYPFLKGVMWRWMESNLGVLSLDARDMEILRTVQKGYYAAGLDESEIMSAHGISSLELQRYLSYNTHFLSVYDLIPEDVYTHGEPFDPYEYLNPHLSEKSVSWTVSTRSVSNF